MMSDGSPFGGFTGTISLRLTDLIQMVCLSRSDLTIEITSQKGKGSIHIREGQIRHAQTDGLSGTEAFFEILQWSDGRFDVLPFQDDCTNSVNKPWEHLLLEAMQLQDETRNPCNGDTAGTHHFEDKPGPEILGKLDDVLGDLLELDQRPDGRPGPAAEGVSGGSLKVMIVDDSAFFSKRLKNMLETDPSIEVVGIARNGKEALELLESGLTVHLITLDVNMPVMSGDTTLKHIMIRYRTPVVILSSIQPHSIRKIFDFLQLGALEYVAKPGVDDDLTSYGERLRELLKRLAPARVSNFRRLRRHNAPARPPAKPDEPAEPRLLVIVGAEGAHMEWFRLPLQELCCLGAVIGLQKLEDGLANRFAQLIEEGTGVKPEYLPHAHEINPGSFYLADVRNEVEFGVRPGRPFMEVSAAGSTPLKWEDGMKLWLERMAEAARDSMTICFLSGVEALPGTLTNRLLGRGVRHVFPPPESVICPQLIDSIKPHAVDFPGLVLHSSFETLPEVL